MRQNISQHFDLELSFAIEIIFYDINELYLRNT